MLLLCKLRLMRLMRLIGPVTTPEGIDRTSHEITLPIFLSST
jgi:hypothetical protein